MTTLQASGMHPLLSSVVHLSFRNAAKQVGCCELQQEQFNRSLRQYLADSPEPTLISDIEEHRLWQAVLNGEVLAVEYLNNEAFLFHVRGKIQSKYIDMRFHYDRDRWKVQAVTSIHQRPFWKSRWRLVTEIITGAVVIAVVSGLSMHAHYTKQGIENWAKQNGYRLVSTGPKASSAFATPSTPPTNSSSTESQQSTTAASTPVTSTTAETTDNHGKNSTATSAKRYSFTFKSGMTVHDISVFLQKHKLVTNAYTFDSVLQRNGVAKSVWPGKYVFGSNMAQKQLIYVLKQGPSR